MPSIGSVQTWSTAVTFIRRILFQPGQRPAIAFKARNSSPCCDFGLFDDRFHVGTDVVNLFCGSEEAPSVFREASPPLRAT